MKTNTINLLKKRNYKPHILITNDDGVLEPGLLALAQEMRTVGIVSVLAPNQNWSGRGGARTDALPLRIKEVELKDGASAIACTGSPSDCVELALSGYVLEKVDLVVSGINPTANVGLGIQASGTVAAALEAASWGIPGIAVSLNSERDCPETIQYQTAAQLTRQIVEELFSHPLPKGVFLNVNVPELPLEEIRGFQMTDLGARVEQAGFIQRRGLRPYAWLSNEVPAGAGKSWTDCDALAQGFVSVTPLQLDLSAYPVLSVLSRWNILGKDHPIEKTYPQLPVS